MQSEDSLQPLLRVFPIPLWEGVRGVSLVQIRETGLFFSFIFESLKRLMGLGVSPRKHQH